MGGFGSGPWEDYTRINIEDCLYFDLTMLKGRVDKIEPDQHHMSSILFKSGRKIFLEFKYLEDDKPIIELTVGEVITTLELTSIVQPFGGVRWWLKCPVTSKRCRKVFLLPRGALFASRAALGLKYRSQRLSKERRLQQQWQLIHIELGGNGGHDEMFPDKPKYMHWNRYSKMYLKCDQLKELSTDFLKEKMNRLIGLGID